MKKLHFVVCTTHNIEDFKIKSDIYRFFDDNKLNANIDYTVYYNNTVGLSKIYNEFISDKFKDKIVVFVHDDVQITHNISTITRDLNEGHKRFNIIGLAGATKIGLKYPTLWHIMNTGDRSGSVGHPYGNNSYIVTAFGPAPSLCAVIDGLFISIDVDKVYNAGLKFDEQFKFHHYDIDFCIQACSKKLLIGTWPIWVTHRSPGLKSLEDINWSLSNKLFCIKYKI